MIYKPLVDPASVVHLVRFKKVVCASKVGRRTKKQDRMTCMLCEQIMNLAYPKEER